LLPEAVTNIKVSQLSGVVVLIVGSDTELLNFLFEKLNDLIHRGRMNWTSRNVRNLMGLRNVQPDADFILCSTNR
jgi:hypothetical protein